MFWELRSRKSGEAARMPIPNEYAPRSESAAGATIADVLKEIQRVREAINELQFRSNAQRELQFQQQSPATEEGVRISERAIHSKESLREALDEAFMRERFMREANQNDCKYITKDISQEVDRIVSERLRDQSRSLCEVMRQLLQDEARLELQSAPSGYSKARSKQRSADTGKDIKHSQLSDKIDIVCIDEEKTENGEKTENRDGPEKTGSDASVAETKSAVCANPPTPNLTQIISDPSVRASFPPSIMHPQLFAGTPSENVKSKTHQDDTYVGSLATMAEFRHRVYTKSLDVRIVLKLKELAFWWSHLQEPKREGLLNNIVTSNYFEGLCILVIVLNSILLAISADRERAKPGSEQPALFRVLELVFLGFYTVEFGMRLALHRWYYFVNSDMAWNLIDVFLLVTSIAVQVMELVYMAGSNLKNITFVRILRLGRLVKVVRAFRAMRFFSDLSVMIQSFAHSLISLFWMSVMLGFVMFVFALIFLQGITEVLADDTGSGITEILKNVTDSLAQGQIHVPELKPYDKYFESTLETMLSLYMSVTGGTDWGDLYRLIQEAGSFYGALYLFFTFFFTFALFNTLTAIIVEKASYAAQPDRDDLVLERWNQSRKDASEFRRLFNSMDSDNDGTLTRKEFDAAMESELMVAYMASIGLEVHEAALFFEILQGAAGKDEVSLEQFVSGCMQMKGSATAIDMQRHIIQMHILHSDMKRFHRKNISSLSLIAEHFDNICQNLWPGKSDSLEETLHRNDEDE